MSDKATILSRIREALKTPAPERHLHGHGTVHSHQIESSDFQAWLPLVGHSWEEQFSLFRKNSEMLKTELVTYTDEADLQAKLHEQAHRDNWKKIGTHRGRWSGKVIEGLSLPSVVTEPGYAVRDIETCDVGITECDALIAQTGSVLVTNASAGGRVLSVLPPHHIILARPDQLVPELESAFKVLRQQYAGNWPSMISFITGPSRTGDIERILVLGAHGPKRLTIYCGLKPGSR